MKRAVMCAAVLGVISASANAQSSVTLFGIIDNGVTYRGMSKVSVNSYHKTFGYENVLDHFDLTW
ncbi:hypothetical protein LMG22037_05817 [Paraburkholderia phenoliruptrix]|uniref:Porin domain-containing protein n=1 Tax=Paraburkholderia phenoliruptrix TaxID=252970 RepID=A0A6J5CEC9_9BURK|nr:porin [Paraburkholderia phenoliruptrix]CAB3733688.1 hypothetical protein LMG22037_05817 [Paraburkholderia phenoliruptrix]